MIKNPDSKNNDREKENQEKMQKRIEELIPDKKELPTPISIQKVEELKARIRELEEKLEMASGILLSPISQPVMETSVQPQVGTPVSDVPNNSSVPRMEDSSKPADSIWRKLVELFRPPTFGDVLKDRVASLENIILWALASAIFFQILLARDLTSFVLLAFMAIGTGFIFFLFRRGYIDVVAWLIILLIALASSYAYALYGFNSNTIISTAVVMALTSFLIRRMNQAVVGNAVIIILFGYSAYLNLDLIEALSAVSSSTVLGLLLTFVSYQISNSFKELDATTNSLRFTNQDLQEKADALTRRTREINLAVEVVQSIAQKVEKSDEMLTNAVELIRKSFNLYYTQIYLTDPSARTVVLRAGTGDVGRQLLARGHRLLVNQNSLNGRSVMEKRPVLVADTSKNEAFLPNPLLPKTKSEMVVPLIIAGKVIGTLDMQSEIPNALNQENLPAFETLAGQIAVAVQNARLFEESERARREVEENIKSLTLTGWRDFMDAIEHKDKLGFVYNAAGISPIQQPDKDAKAENGLDVLIEVRGAKIGVIQAIREERLLEERESEILKAASAQLARHIDSLRLLGQASQYRLEAEEAARRLTREGWEEFMASQKDLGHGYAYHQNKVIPILMDSGNGHKDGLAQPITVRDEVIGELAADTPKESGEDTQRLIATISRQLSDHLEGLRLLEQAEQRRIEAEALLRELDTQKFALDQHSIVGITDQTGKIIYANDKFVEVSKYSRKELVGQDHRILNSGYHSKEFIRDMWVTIANGRVWHGEILNKAKNGTLYWVDTTIVPFLNTDGKPYRYVAIRSDITERKRYEESLRANEMLLSEAMVMAKLGSWEYDFKKDLFTFNDNYYSLFHTSVRDIGSYQMSSADYIGRFVHPEDAEKLRIEIRKAISSDERFYSASLEHRVVLFDKSTGFMQVNIEVERDRDGEVVRFHGTNQDVTERKHNEEILRLSEASLSEAMHIARLGNWEYDVEKDVFTFNDNFYTIFHTSAQEVGGYQMSSGEYAARFVHPDDISVVGAEIGKAISSTERGYSSSLEHRIIYADMSVGYISVKVNVERDENGKIIRFYGANQDITESKKAEEDLLRLQSAVEQTGDGIALADLQGYLIYSNPAWAAMHGFTPEEIPGKYMSIFHTEEQMEKEVFPFNQQVMAHGTYTAEVNHVRKDGTVFPTLQSVTVRKDTNGKPVGMIGTARDITESKKAEEALRESEARYSAVLNQATDGAVLIQDNVVKYVNKALAELLGYTTAEMENQSMINFIAPESRKLIASRIQARLAGEDVPSLYEAKLLRKDGSLVDVELSAGVIEYLGKPADFGFARDITDRKKSQNVIARRALELATVANVSTTASTVLDPEKLLKSVVDLTRERFNLYHAHIYLLDEKANTLDLASGAGEVGANMVSTGFAISLDAEVSLVARSARDRKAIIVNDVREEAGFLPNPLLPETRSEMAVPMIVGDTLLGVFDVQSSSVSHFTEEEANIYTTLASQVAVALQNARLYTEINKTAERLREVDKMKSEFLANMSHELRTPLNSLIGYAEILLTGIDGELDEEKQEDVQAIFDNAKHLLSLINDVLDLAKIEAGRLVLKKEDVDITDLIENVKNNSFGLIHTLKKPLETLVTIDTDLPKIFIDPVRISQVLNNLVSNAIKFSDKGVVLIRAFLDNEWLVVEVEDEGVGIAQSDIQRIFERFSQVDGSTTRRVEGTGLGLPISYHLVEMHGGSLRVESEVGKGSKFTIRLPLVVELEAV